MKIISVSEYFSIPEGRFSALSGSKKQKEGTSVSGVFPLFLKEDGG
jgi:hypothetical protein